MESNTSKTLTSGSILVNKPVKPSSARALLKTIADEDSKVLQKWDETGMLESVVGVEHKREMAWMLDNASQHLGLNEMHSTGRLTTWQQILLPTTCRVFTELLKREDRGEVSIKAMRLPVDQFKAQGLRHTIVADTQTLPIEFKNGEVDQILMGGYLKIDGQTELCDQLTKKATEALNELISQKAGILGYKSFYFYVLICPIFSQDHMGVVFKTRYAGYKS